MSQLWNDAVRIAEQRYAVKEFILRRVARMSAATCGTAGRQSLNGSVPAQFHSGRRLFLHGDACGSTVVRIGRHIAALRAAIRAARRERPFAIDAIVILPDHLHAIFALPPGDCDFRGRWRRIKGHFSTHLVTQGRAQRRYADGRPAVWQRRFWEHTIRDEDDFARHVDPGSTPEQA